MSIFKLIHNRIGTQEKMAYLLQVLLALLLFSVQIRKTPNGDCADNSTGGQFQIMHTHRGRKQLKYQSCAR